VGWWILRLQRVQRAQAMVEYALILVLVAVVVIAVLVSLGQGLTATFQKIVDSLNK
jgi:pilus assembly protein Flp/PilA